MKHILFCLLLLLSLSLSLTSCEDMRNFFASENIVNEGWAAKAKKYTPKKTYCYRTIAGIDCYDEPQRGEESRLVEKYDDEDEENKESGNKEGKANL